ncbi:codanin-1 [Neodiprion virginianus]|uniref:codanin-1 n=1 Tax=Neodiprion virginianus TaxID=2961670 RepID=UPI001EE751FE|nr:codanin-1 [Neodiprion virginianus]
MANILLTNALSGRIVVEDIIEWLTTDDVENSKWDSFNKSGCTQCDFLLYFLSFLRQQTKSILHGSYNARQTPNKDIQCCGATNDRSQKKNERPHRGVSLFNADANSDPHSINEDLQSMRGHARNGASAVSEQEMSPMTNTVKLNKKSQLRESDVISEGQVMFTVHRTGENQSLSITTGTKTPDKMRVDINSSDCSHIPQKTTTSTPLVKTDPPSKINKIFNGFSQHVSKADVLGLTTDANFQLCSTPDMKTLSTKKPGSYTGILENLTNSNENFDISNCLSISKNLKTTNKLTSYSRNGINDSSSSNTTSVFGDSNKDWHHLNSLNMSPGSNNSTVNESVVLNNFMIVNNNCEAPISPLYISNATTPQNSKLSYSRSVERYQYSKSSPQHFNDNSPKQGFHHIQRNLKSTPRQNASLGDFISIDSRGSKKSSLRKTNTRVQSGKSSDSDGSVTDKLSITEDSFPEIGKSCGRRKRRIKPTKLDTSDDKGIRENKTFGTISRPQIVNPQFLEILQADKPDTTPFEIERDLLRLERQKQQKSTSNTSAEHVIDSCILSKTPNVKTSTELLLTPSLQYVENRQALDILVKIYSSLLDYNLVINPMTELNFVISLITLQHSFANDKYRSLSDNHSLKERSNAVRSIIKENSLDESDDCLIDKHKNSKKCANIEFLNEELGCRVLNDDNILTMDENVSLQREIEVDKVFDKLGRSSLDCKQSSCTCEGQLNVSKEKIPIPDEEYFQTIHNCIYFSTSFLNTQRVLLSLLDRTTLKLLCENNRIATFSPDLQEYLSQCYRGKLNESSQLKQHFNTFSTTEANVSFQIDTDNRENFPSLVGFQSFRKQRDLFYDVLRIWETHHLAPGWVFSIALAGKIRTLLSLHNDAVNYCHFARLFKSQLLLSCIGNDSKEEPVNDESFNFLKSLKHVDPEKLTRLRERLVTPLSSKGPVPPPSFPGVQEFYKDFILHAANPMFYAHLQDCLVHEIMELNDTQFMGSEIEDTETMVDQETKQNFITCILSLRLLAKVLGFLISLPYRCEPHSPVSVLTTQLELRSQVLPPLNLQYCLQTAIINGKLALTVPWVVKYLALLDPMSLRLPYYKTVLEMLCYIYCESKHDSRLENPLSLKVKILLKFSIGWLFELCNFPERLYFNCRISSTHRKFKSISNFSAKNLQSTLATDIERTSSDLNQSSNSGPCTDSLDIIDERILYVCCPFLAELKTLLIADHSNLNNSATIRHITPVSRGFEKPFCSTSTKQLQLQLEEAFFHGQPISTRKTVDFVSERVASSCVKHICNSALPRARKKNIVKFQGVLSQRILPDDINKFKSSITVEMQSIASNLSLELKTHCEADILAMCESRTMKSIDSLLAEDTLPSVKQICSQIAVRMATERVKNWIQSHITDGSLFFKDMEMEVDKAYKNKSIPTQLKKKVHNAEAASPTDVIIELRSIIWELLENKGKSVTLRSVLQSLDNVYKSLTERADLLLGPEKIIGSMSVDLALFLAAHRTDIFVSEVHAKLIRIWKMECVNFLKKEFILSRILSPRNIMLLATPQNPDVWLPLGKFIKRLLKEEILNVEAFSDQCTMLFRYDWPIDILKHLSICLTNGIEDFKSTNEANEKMKLLLQWIAETCAEMEFTFD